METYYVTTRQSFYKDYKVEASSKEEAEKIVMNEPIDYYNSDYGDDVQVVKGSTLTEEEENS
tara:strand:+ start:327 stop:512 length:186 start_codon:yes stop_codon:yes gene_type:complete